MQKVFALLARESSQLPCLSILILSAALEEIPDSPL